MVVAVVGVCGGRAEAGSGGQMVVLESHVGSETGSGATEDGSYYVEMMMRSLGGDAPLWGDKLRAKVEAQVSRAGGAVTDAAALRAQVKDGRRQFIEGEFAKAIAELEDARAKLLKAPASVASDQSLRDALHMALLMAAHAMMRSGQMDKATARVSEAIRSYPDRDLSMVEYGPELVDFYRKVRRELSKQKRGVLKVETEPAGCLVFVNERYVGLSPARVPDLYPGTYRVYVQKPSLRGRVHEVKVEGGEQQVRVDFELDRVLQTERTVGLSFGDAQEMEANEAADAAKVGRGVGASQVIVIGVRPMGGVKTLLGRVISTDTEAVVRGGMLSLEPGAPSPAAVRSLGQLLVLGTAAQPPVRPIEPEKKPVAGATDTGSGGWMRWAKWVGLGVAAGALAAGITLLVLDGQGTCDLPEGVRCPGTYDTQGAGIALTAVGGAAAAGAVVLFVLDARHQKQRMAILPLGPAGSGGLTALLRF